MRWKLTTLIENHVDKEERYMCEHGLAILIESENQEEQVCLLMDTGHHFEMNGAAVSSGMGTCGLVGQIGVYTGWVNDVASGAKAAVTGMDWLGLVLISFVLPAVLTWLIAIPLRKWGWIKDGDLKLDL